MNVISVCVGACVRVGVGVGGVWVCVCVCVKFILTYTCIVFECRRDEIPYFLQLFACFIYVTELYRQKCTVDPVES